MWLEENLTHAEISMYESGRQVHGLMVLQEYVRTGGTVYVRPFGR